MTTAQFKLLLSNGPVTLNDPNRPFAINLNGNKISDIALRITSFDILQLQQATSITLGKLPESGQSSFTISVENKESSGKTVDREIVDGYFVYTFLQNQPTVVGSINYQPALNTQGNPTGLNIEDYITSILIEPGEVLFKIENSDYQVLQNNASKSRTSKYRRISDRKDTTINPLNIEGIISGTADLADIQDSNYSDTGWVNSRYRGTFTNRDMYKGIDAVIFVKSFEGSFYPSGTLDNNISKQDTAERNYETFLHTGKDTFPTYSLDTPVNYIYRTEGNKPVTISEGKIRVKDTGDILYVNNTGSVFQMKPYIIP